MRLFRCERCSSVLFFENDRCGRCGVDLGYHPTRGELVALDAAEVDPIAASGLRCRNAVEYQACNWLVDQGGDAVYCRSCELNLVVPDLGDEDAAAQWRRIETAKRRTLYTLFSLGLPVASDPGDPGAAAPPLSFRFLRDTPDEKVVTGHADGVITINAAEANAAFRENTREQLGEDYRTLLGHFRHEVGHYYWDRLVRDTRWLEPFRELFGDERASYAEAVERHYAQGPPAGWRQSFISAYATMHPWEDWAETWAHYLHMVDTLETAASYGLTVRQPSGDDDSANPTHSHAVDFTDFASIIAAWYPVTLALNSLNRSMGTDDPYPFALAPTSEAKLAFVHDVIRSAGG